MGLLRSPSLSLSLSLPATHRKHVTLLLAYCLTILERLVTAPCYTIIHNITTNCDVATVAILVHYGLLVKGLRPKDVNYVMCGVWLREVYQEQDQNADVG